MPESLWLIIEPLLPPALPTPKGGRPPVPARAALTGILFVLRTGIPKVAAGMPAVYAEMLLGVFVVARRGDFAAIDRTLQTLLGRAPKTMREAISAFRLWVLLQGIVSLRRLIHPECVRVGNAEQCSAT